MERIKFQGDLTYSIKTLIEMNSTYKNIIKEKMREIERIKKSIKENESRINSGSIPLTL